MPKSRSRPKEKLISTRVTPTIKSIVFNEAEREGLTISEWLRNLIVVELRRRNLLPRVPQVPRIKEG
ncbi:TPA: hypothetical protein EYP44_02305 [Candidatus Bathyarchaeota archaeon]|nr:hypothetical protein [Candidatus Bathyarchaeota archaeon]